MSREETDIRIWQKGQNLYYLLHAWLKPDQPLPTNKDYHLADAFLRKLFGDLNCFTSKELDQHPLGKDNVIAPHIATTSAWASKATNIMHLLEPSLSHLHIEHAWLDNNSNSDQQLSDLSSQMFDRMLYQRDTLELLSLQLGITTLRGYPPEEKISAPTKVNKELITEFANELDLSFDDYELNHLNTHFCNQQRMPTYSELMMFAQANSEHCRHKIFRAQVPDTPNNASMMDMIKEPFNQQQSQFKNVLSAFSDNAAVISFGTAAALNISECNYSTSKTTYHTVIKAETHNHPTAVSPHPGASTGVGGEIRDEAATGTGARTLAGFCGYIVSNLPHKNKEKINLPRLASAKQIMLQAPIGAANYNNEFGRPNLSGFFRTLEQTSEKKEFGYFKPVMFAGGIGQIRHEHALKQPESIDSSQNVLVGHLGGPGMRIGIGGGSISSVTGGTTEDTLDFASVQRANPQLERLAQEAIYRLTNLGDKNPILSIHDVGAGGLANAVTELLADTDCTGDISLEDIPISQSNLSASEIWCNESQERFVFLADQKNQKLIERICKTENCPLHWIGEAKKQSNRKDARLHLYDKDASPDNPNIINMPLDAIVGKIGIEAHDSKFWPTDWQDPQKTRESANQIQNLIKPDFDFTEQLLAVLEDPAVASKRFLITIADRSVGGLVAGQQMLGQSQVPVADCAVTLQDFEQNEAVAFGLGECPQIAIKDPAAAARMGVAEALSNLAATKVQIDDVKLSVNWMADCSEPFQIGELYRAVSAVAGNSGFCNQIGTGIIVGKDSLSMAVKAVKDEHKKISSPVTAVVSAVAKCTSTKEKTPVLNLSAEKTLLVKLSPHAKYRLGQSTLARINNWDDLPYPDISADEFKNYFDLLMQLHEQNITLAYHDISDGGLLTCVSEMLFASSINNELGCNLQLDYLIEQEPKEMADETAKNTILDQAKIAATLFNEEIGCVIQIEHSQLDTLNQLAAASKCECKVIGKVLKQESAILKVKYAFKDLLKIELADLRNAWERTNKYICQEAGRDNPDLCQQEIDLAKSGSALVISNCDKLIDRRTAHNKTTPKLKACLLRDQGTNGHYEMAAALMHAGFEVIDANISQSDDDVADAINHSSLVVIPGGFSHGDTFGAGLGSAAIIAQRKKIIDSLHHHLHTKKGLLLGVCNGCQIISHLDELISRDSNLTNLKLFDKKFPSFEPNASLRYEARYLTLKVSESNNHFLKGMDELLVPAIISHGEGRSVYTDSSDVAQAVLHYADDQGQPSAIYPYNPNGSHHGATGFSTNDGRVLIMMPHPERAFLKSQCPWLPESWLNHSTRYGPWMQLFDNAYTYAKGNL